MLSREGAPGEVTVTFGGGWRTGDLGSAFWKAQIFGKGMCVQVHGVCERLDLGVEG